MISSSSRDAALCAGWASIEALAVAAVAVAVTATLPAGSLRVGAMPLIALMVSAALAGRLSARVPLRPPFGRLLALPAGTLLALAWLRLGVPAAPSPVAASALALLALLVSARGLFIGLSEPAQEAVMRAFLRGMVALMVLFALLSLAQVEVTAALRAHLRTLVLGYFAMGPTVVALAQRRTLRRARGIHAALTPSWLLAVALPILSALVFAMVTSRGSDGLREGLTVASRTVGAAVDLTARAIGWAAYASVLALAWFARLFPSSRGHHGTPPPPPPASDPVTAPEVAVGIAAPSVAQHDIAAGVLLVTAALFLTIYVSKLLRAPVESDDPFDVDEERASLWSWQLMAQQARELLRALLRGTRADHRGAQAGGASCTTAASGELTSVRAVYRAFLRWADARGGVLRAPATTAHELAARLPCSEEQRPHLDALTDLYSSARYGEHAETPSRLGRARAHFDALTTRPSPPMRDRDPNEPAATERSSTRT